jgi:hypothetical protein
MWEGVNQGKRPTQLESEQGEVPDIHTLYLHTTIYVTSIRLTYTLVVRGTGTPKDMGHFYYEQQIKRDTGNTGVGGELPKKKNHHKRV